MILVQSEFYLSAVVTKRYQCTQEDVRKLMGNCLQNAPTRARRSQKNPQAIDEERYQVEIKQVTKEKRRNGRYM